MKLLFFVIAFFYFQVISCQSNITDTSDRIYIKSVQIDSTKRIDWYIKSLIGGFSKSYLVLSSKSETIFFSSHGVTNFNVDTVKKVIEVELINEYASNFVKKDNMKLFNYKIYIASGGFELNQGSDRFSRLHSKNIETTKPHFHNSDF